MTPLPFRFEAALLDAGGEPVVGVDPVPCSIWPATSSAIAAAGRHHTHSGEAALDFAQALGVPNRQLELGPEAGAVAGRYRITAATPMEIVPHVVLELNRTSGRA